MKQSITVAAALAGAVAVAYGAGVPNLTSLCMRCPCFASTNCTLNKGCDEIQRYCGPFWIAPIYWADSGKHVLLHDNVARDGAFQDCAKDYGCASTMVTKYMTKFKRDCNKDGFINCDDYALMHYYGDQSCDEKGLAEAEFLRTNFGARYQQCRPGAILDSVKTTMLKG